MLILINALWILRIRQVTSNLWVHLAIGGTSLNGTFHWFTLAAAITQAICDGCGQFGATGPLFVGQDTHALSQPALITVLEVLAGNGVTAMVDADMDFVPTPSVSPIIRCIMKVTIVRRTALWLHRPIILQIMVVSSYNATNGGPADIPLLQSGLKLALVMSMYVHIVN